MDRTHGIPRSLSSPAAEPQELRPLLHDTAPTPVCGHCLLCLSGKHFLVALWILFLYNLFETHRFEVWGQTAVVFVLADVLYVACVVFCLLSVVGLLLAVRPGDPCSVACYALYLGVALSVSWYSLVQIAFMHDLEVTCMHPGDCPSREGGLSVSRLFAHWALFPTGLLHAFGAVLWRPWHFLIFEVPLAVVSGETRSMPSTRIWWQMRQILVGTVLWSCFILQASALLIRDAAVEIERWVHCMLMLGSCVITALAFYATADPVMWFWCFLADPWLKAANHQPNFRIEELLAACLVLWWALRFFYVVVHGEAERWNAKKNMEEALSYALANPFRAELEQGFADLESGNGTQPSLARQLSRLGSTILAGDATEAPASSSLKEKRKKLISARRGILQHQAAGAVALPGCLSLNIRRKNLLEDTWAALFDRPVSELLAPKMSVSFEGESGIDMGGPTRDWFDTVAQRLAEGAGDVRGSSLLATAPDGTLIPRPIVGATEEVSQGNKERYSELMALGKFIALAIYRDRPLPLSFSLIACKHFLEVPVGKDDVFRLDPDFFRLRVAQVMKDGGLTEMQEALGEPLYFLSAPTELRPQPVELKPGGAQIIVTEQNKAEYVQLLCEAYLCGDIRRELQCLLQGFWLLFPRELLRQCKVTPQDLSILISGIANLDPDEWRKHSDPQSNDQVHEWFWQFVKQLDAERRCMLLQFATGSSRLPPGGFADLEPRFNISLSEADSDEHLPHAHTCVNQLVLPKYSCYDRLSAKLLLAISTEGLGFQIA